MFFVILSAAAFIILLQILIFFLFFIGDLSILSILRMSGLPTLYTSVILCLVLESLCTVFLQRLAENSQGNSLRQQSAIVSSMAWKAFS